MTTEDYLSEAEFCARYHLSRRSAQRWRTSGDGPKFVRAGLRRVLYRLADCEAWAAAHTFEHRADEMVHGASCAQAEDSIRRNASQL